MVEESEQKSHSWNREDNIYAVMGRFKESMKSVDIWTAKWKDKLLALVFNAKVKWILLGQPLSEIKCP